MANLPDLRDDSTPSRRRSTLSVLDDGLLVVVGVIAALVALKVFGVIAGAIFFLIKLAFVAGLIFVVGRLLIGRRK